MRIDWKEATVLCLVSTLIAVAILFVGQLTSLWGQAPSGTLAPGTPAAQGPAQPSTPSLAQSSPDAQGGSVFAPLTPRQVPTTPATPLSVSTPARGTATPAAVTPARPTSAAREATFPAPTPRTSVNPPVTPTPAGSTARADDAARPTAQPSPAPATATASEVKSGTATRGPLPAAASRPAPAVSPSETFGQRVAPGVVVGAAQVQARTPTPAPTPRQTPGVTRQGTAPTATRAPQAAQPTTPPRTPATTAPRPSPRVPSGPEPVPGTTSRAPAAGARTPAAPTTAPASARELTPEPAVPAEIGAEVAPPPDPGVSMGLLVRGRELARLLYGGQLDQLWASFGPEARSQWGDLSTLAAYRSSSPEAHWTEQRLLREEVRAEGGGTAYLRTVTYQDDPGTPWTLVFRLANDGRVSHFEVVAAESN